MFKPSNPGRILLVLTAILASQANPALAKICAGKTCVVPAGADCSTYGESIVTGTTTGSETPHNGVILIVMENKNCEGECAGTKTNKSTHSVADTRTVTLTFTVGGSASAAVKGGVGLPIVANAEVTASLTRDFSASVGGTTTATTTTTAECTWNTPCGKKERCRVLADWVDSTYAKSGYIHSWYFNYDTGSWENTDCDNVTGVATGKRQYKAWITEFLGLSNCP